MAKPLHKQLEEAGTRSLPEGRQAPEAPTAEELSKRWKLNAGGIGALAVVGALLVKSLKLVALFHFAGIARALGWGWGGLLLAVLVLGGIVIERLVARRRAERSSLFTQKPGGGS